MKEENKKKLICILIAGLLVVFVSLISFIACDKKDETNINANSNSNKEITIELEEEYVLELGTIPSIDMFTSVDGADMQIYYDNKEVIGALNNEGEYQVVITYNDKKYKTKILVEEGVPVLLLKELTINEGDSYKANDFIEKVEGTKDYSILFTDEKLGSYAKTGTYDISIKLIYGNNEIVVNNTKLIIRAEVTTSNSNKRSNKTSNQVSSKTSNQMSNKTSNQVSNKTSNKTSNPTSNKNSNNNSVSNVNTNKPVTVVKTENKQSTSKEEKYGAVIITTTKYVLTTYSDGSTKKTNTSTSKSLDSSGFTTSTSAMLSEATSISNNTLSERKEVTNYVNQYRKEANSNLNSLVLDEKLSVAATIRAMELAYTDYKYKHNRPNGESYYTVISEVYGNSNYTGENIAYGSGGLLDTSKEVSESWRDSTSHYNLMISDKFTKIGVGHVTLLDKDYWVQLFVK